MAIQYPRTIKADEQRNDDHRADKAKLLAGNGENIVVMLLRQIQIFLAALAEAQARQAAGADGIAGLNDLVALIRGVLLRVEPGGDSVCGVALGGKIHHQQQRNNKTAQDQPFLSVPPSVMRIKPSARNDRRRHVRFEVEQHGDDAQDHDIGRHTVAEGLHPVVCAAIIAANVSTMPI